MAMDRRKTRRLPNINDENMKTFNKNKLNQTKAPSEMKRAILCDLGPNKIANGILSSQDTVSAIYKSKLPVLRAGYSKTKNVSGVNKLKVSNSKENQVSFGISEKQIVTSIINKTKTLKLETHRNVDPLRSVKDKVEKKTKSAEIEDIDENDYKNPFLVAVYAKDIHNYLKYLEQTHALQEDYLKGRSITPKMRSILIDWLIEVQQEYQLLQETIHIAVGILDSYLQDKPDVNRHHMQLIGVSALFLASKYEEIVVPSVEELVYISASAFKENDLYQMEREMFKTVNFDLSRPISLSFLRRYSKAANAKTLQHTFAKYFLDLSLLEYSLCHVHPSLIAAASLFLALFVTQNDLEKIDATLWTPTLAHYSEYKYIDLKPVVHALAEIVYNAKSSDYQSVYSKYSSSKLARVSLNPDLYTPRMKMLALIK